MPDNKIGRPSSGRDDVSTKIDRKLLRKLHFVASYEGKAVAALLSELLESPVNGRYERIAKEIGGVEGGGESEG